MNPADTLEKRTLPEQAATGAARPRWLGYALATALLWGVWGAFAGLPTQNGFPETLVYVVWALTMVPPALFVLAYFGICRTCSGLACKFRASTCNAWRIRNDYLH